MRPAPLRPAATVSTAAAQPQRYLTNDEAAEYLRLSPRTLEKQRVIGGGPRASSAAASCTPWPTSMPGPLTAASRRLPIPNTPSTTRPTAVRADRRRAAGHRHVQHRAAVPAAAVAGARTARPVPRLARRHGAARQPGFDGLSVLSLAKSKRVKPIDFRAGNVTIRVEGTQEHGIATIWDADVLIWAASQIVEAKDAGLRPSRLMHATPYEILASSGAASAARLPAPQGGLGSPAIDHGGHVHPRDDRAAIAPLLLDQRVEGTGRRQRHAAGHRAILPDWFYAGVLDAALVLTIDPAYFRLTGGIERWLYRLVRKHGGRQEHGWQFDFRYLHQKSGSTAMPYDFACDLRALVARQSLPGYVLGIERMPDNGMELLIPARAADGTGITPGKPVNSVVLSGVRGIVLSGVGLSCYQACRSAGNPRQHWVYAPLTSLT